MLCGIACLINPQNLRIALQKYRYFMLIQIVTPQSIWVLTFNLPCANIKYSLSERLWTKHCTWRSSFYFHCYDISMNEGEIVEKVTVEEVTMTCPVYMAPSVIIWMNEYMFKSTPPNTSKGFFVNKIVIFAWQIEQFYMSRLDFQQSHHACNNHSTYSLDTSKW